MTRRPWLHVSQAWLWAGMAQAVVAQKGSRRGIVGAIALHAIGNRVVIARRCRFDHRPAVVIRCIIIGRACVIGAVAIIGALRSQRPTDHGTSHDAGKETAMAAVTVAVTVIMTA